VTRPVSALYVEDDDSTFFLVQTALAEANLAVELRRARDGDEALRLLGSRDGVKPAAVLLDLNLPRVSGFEVLENARFALRQIPFYVLSTSAFAQDRERSLRLGAKGFYTKPSSFDGLIRLLRSIFDGNGAA
jgi:DNA-binding response OmpR family regulator